MNDYLKKRKEEKQLYLNEGMRIGEQFAIDMFQVALHRKGWGYDRMIDLMKLVHELSDYYFDALNLCMEQDVRQVQLDRELADLLKGHQELIPFEKRYDTVKTVGYDRMPKR